MTDGLRRLHPASILIELLRRLGSFAYIFAVALALRFFGGNSRTDTYDYAIAGLAVFTALGAVLRYITLRFGVQDRHLVVRSGLIVKQHRTIPLDRIQNVQLRRTLLHRALGLVDVDVETAGGATPEARLSALSVADAERLKAELMQRSAVTPAIAAAAESAAVVGTGAPPTAPMATQGEIVWSSSTWELLLAGATENRLGVILAAVSGVAYTFQEVLERVLRKHATEWFNAAAGHQTLLIAAAIAGAALLILVGWIASIAITYVQYFGFQLRRDERRLRLRYGLFTQVEKLLPTTRIQTIRLEAPWLRRLLGCTTVLADTAGSAVEHAAGESTPLCPLLHVDKLTGFVRNIFPSLRLETLQWLPVSRLTIRRGFLRYALLVAVLYSPFAWLLGWYGPGLVAIGLALAGLAAYARFRALAYAEHGDFLFARAGVVTRRTWIIPRTKIQWIELVQTPFQRRIGLASLMIHTAAPGSRLASVVDLPEATAVRLQERLSLFSNQTGLVLDGV